MQFAKALFWFTNSSTPSCFRCILETSFGLLSETSLKVSDFRNTQKNMVWFLFATTSIAQASSKLGLGREQWRLPMVFLRSEPGARTCPTTPAGVPGTLGSPSPSQGWRGAKAGPGCIYQQDFTSVCTCTEPMPDACQLGYHNIFHSNIPYFQKTKISLFFVCLFLMV